MLKTQMDLKADTGRPSEAARGPAYECPIEPVPDQV